MDNLYKFRKETGRVIFIGDKEEHNVGKRTNDL